jgi:hypothetical protein
MGKIGVTLEGLLWKWETGYEHSFEFASEVERVKDLIVWLLPELSKSREHLFSLVGCKNSLVAQAILDGAKRAKERGKEAELDAREHIRELVQLLKMGCVDRWIVQHDFGDVSFWAEVAAALIESSLGGDAQELILNQAECDKIELSRCDLSRLLSASVKGDDPKAFASYYGEWRSRGYPGEPSLLIEGEIACRQVWEYMIKELVAEKNYRRLGGLIQELRDDKGIKELLAKVDLEDLCSNIDYSLLHHAAANWGVELVQWLLLDGELDINREYLDRTAFDIVLELIEKKSEKRDWAEVVQIFLERDELDLVGLQSGSDKPVVSSPGRLLKIIFGTERIVLLKLLLRRRDFDLDAALRDGEIRDLLEQMIWLGSLNIKKEPWEQDGIFPSQQKVILDALGLLAIDRRVSSFEMKFLSNWKKSLDAGHPVALSEEGIEKIGWNLVALYQLATMGGSDQFAKWIISYREAFQRVEERLQIGWNSAVECRSIRRLTEIFPGAIEELDRCAGGAFALLLFYEDGLLNFKDVQR